MYRSGFNCKDAFLKKNRFLLGLFFMWWMLEIQYLRMTPKTLPVFFLLFTLPSLDLSWNSQDLFSKPILFVELSHRTLQVHKRFPKPVVNMLCKSSFIYQCNWSPTRSVIWSIVCLHGVMAFSGISTTIVHCFDDHLWLPLSETDSRTEQAMGLYKTC